MDFIDSKGHVHELVFVPTLTGKGDWKDDDLTELAKSGSTAVARSPLAGYSGGQTRSDVSQHLNYIASDGHVHELYNTPTTMTGWKDNDLTKLAKSSSIPGVWSTLHGYWGWGEDHVNYIESNGHVHELYDSPTTAWKDNDLTELSREENAQSGSTAIQGSSLAGYRGNTDLFPTMEGAAVNYIDSNGHVHEMLNVRPEVMQNAEWKDVDLMAVAAIFPFPTQLISSSSLYAYMSNALIK